MEGRKGRAFVPRDMRGRRGVRRVVDAFADKDLLVDAGSLAFRALLALIPALLFIYLSSFASYGSIFGSPATVFVLIEYLYLVSVVFLGGIVIDSLVDGQERHD